jgi:hypothetical protein
MLVKFQIQQLALALYRCIKLPHINSAIPNMLLIYLA